MTQNKSNGKKIIIEKKLGIPADYQYQAIRSKNFLQANWHKNKLLALETLLPLSSEKRILDLGTGSGNFELAFSHKVKQIIGVDYNDEALSFLKGRLRIDGISNVSLIFTDIRNLSPLLKYPKFDYIVAVDVIEHIRISEAQTVVKSIYKLLKPGGKVCIITPNYQSAWIFIESVLDKLTIVPKFKGEQHLAKYHKHNLSEIFEACGFQLVTFRTFNTFSYIFPSSRLSGNICKLELMFPFSYGNMIAAVFVKK